MSFVFPGINKTFKNFIKELLDIEFEEFDKIAKNDKEKRFKGKVFEYFLYELAAHNGMIVEMNQTFISFSRTIFKSLSDGCTDLHGQYRQLHWFAQCKYKSGNIKIQVTEIREFLNTAKRKTNYNIAFFISNTELNNYAINELKNYTGDKDKICVCLIKDFIPKIYEYENIFINNKIKLEQEKNKCLEYEIENRILKTYNEKLENLNNKLEKEIKEIKEEIKENNRKFDLILDILNKK
ncbi:12263_t:CDS:2 [Cetraspora pellucida]|uniref:12263_t:CDS:1 n=1 Tax=Cetraspora pellucida TaxID=1433469 RepID=A0ACA9P2H2_9GLOM|nr:12263_t:CDS:2 [Cetraspora pellucida]